MTFDLYRSKWSKIALSSIFALFFVLAVSCNEQPTKLGSSLLLDTVRVYSLSSNDTNFIEFSQSDYVPMDNINQQVLLIGRSGETKAVSLIRYVVPDSSKSDPKLPISEIEEADIISAQLEMPINRYAFGDSLNPSALSFNAYRIDRSWEEKLSWDSLYSGNDIGSSPYYSEANSVAFFNEQIEQVSIERLDSSMTTYTFDIDRSYIADLFDLQNDTNQYDKGLIFVPGSGSSVIRQFNAEQVVTEIYPNDLEVFREHRIKVIYEKNSVRDTIYLVSGITKNICYSPPSADGFLVLQGSVYRWSKLKFDLSFIPRFAAIHRAELTLTLDRSKCEWGNFGLDSTLAGEYATDSSYSNPESIGLFYALNDGNDKFIVSDLVGALRFYNQNKGFGYAILKPEGLRNNIREIDRLVFYGMDNPDEDKRPFLKVIYSTRPDFDAE